jgi:hypothetical protein
VTLGPAVCNALAGNPFIPPADFCEVYDTVATAYLAIPANQRRNLFGPLIRLAFHDAGEADLTQPDSLGPDGCLSSDTANAGLNGACDEVTLDLEPMWQEVCGKISRADFWALMAKLAVEEAFPNGVASTVKFAYGRRDATECEAGAGRLPQATEGLEEIGRVFEVQMGLTEADAVTLIGAHSVGRVCPANSGFGLGPGGSTWDNTPTVLDNNFYINLLDQPWIRSQTRGQYLRPRGNNDIMLNTDMSLGFDIKADDPGFIDAPEFARCVTGQSCGAPTASVYDLVTLYARSEQAVFANAFATSFERMINVGYSTVPGLDNSLTTFDPSTCVA